MAHPHWSLMDFKLREEFPCIYKVAELILKFSLKGEDKINEKQLYF